MIRRLLTLSIAVAAVCFTGAAFTHDATMTTMDNVENFSIPFWLDQRRSA
jgi:hypothetical protein